MRTTLTLDEDVAQALDRLRRERGVRYRELVNDLLRRGLAAEAEGTRTAERHEAYAIEPADGKPRLASLDDVAECLEITEGRDG